MDLRWLNHFLAGRRPGEISAARLRALEKRAAADERAVKEAATAQAKLISEQNIEANWRWLIDYTKREKGALIEGNFLRGTKDIGGKLQASVSEHTWGVVVGLCEMTLDEWRPPNRWAGPAFRGDSLAFVVRHHVLPEFSAYREFLTFCRKQGYTCDVFGGENNPAPYADNYVEPNLISAGLRVTFR